MTIWSKNFWKATVERVVQGGAAAVAGGFFAGDAVFDAFNVNTWGDVASLFIGGGVSMLVLSLAGNLVSGNGPAFNSAEVVKKEPLAPVEAHNPPEQF